MDQKEVIRDKDGNIVSKSRNLRGILREFGKTLVKSISIDKINNGEGKLLVIFDNGNTFETNFADFNVLENWIKNRRTLKGLIILNNGIEQKL